MPTQWLKVFFIVDFDVPAGAGLIYNCEFIRPVRKYDGELSATVSIFVVSFYLFYFINIYMVPIRTRYNNHKIKY